MGFYTEDKEKGEKFTPQHPGRTVSQTVVLGPLDGLPLRQVGHTEVVPT